MKYDLDLFVRLNDEYRKKPIVDTVALDERRRMLSPTREDRRAQGPDARIQFAAKNQLKAILADVDLKDRSVLELGCGHGYLTAALVEVAGAANAVGIDVQRSDSWTELDDPRLSLVAADISVTPVVPNESIDVIVSRVAFEHVSRPLQMLKALFDVLKDGGMASLYMNVYTARNASHMYREVYFPWPHLLFEDDVVAEYYRRFHGRPEAHWVWINRMSVAHYLLACNEIGFNIVRVRRAVSPIDVPFYIRFVDKLGAYQALDLETEFVTLILRKDKNTLKPDNLAITTAKYVERQFALDDAIARHVIESSSDDLARSG